jgi:putative transposase
MPRPNRAHAVGLTMHVTLRGNDRQPIFQSDIDRSHLSDLMHEGVRRFNHRVHAFCFMTNHLHFMIQVAESRIGAIVQHFASAYAHYFNKRYERVGHLFENRFKSTLVQDDAYAMQLLRYIHRNPVEANLCDNAADYRWSSHKAYLGRAYWTWLTIDWGLDLFDLDRTGAIATFQRFVDRPELEIAAQAPATAAAIQQVFSTISHGAADPLARSRPIARVPRSMHSANRRATAICRKFAESLRR